MQPNLKNKRPISLSDPCFDVSFSVSIMCKVSLISVYSKILDPHFLKGVFLPDEIWFGLKIKVEPYRGGRRGLRLAGKDVTTFNIAF
jgi:hypothetical protein